jgi:CobQ-like glutamine amidotransferase family enzyme
MIELNLAWLYDDLLELYSDSGNIQILKKRCGARNIKLNVHKMSLGSVDNLDKMDMIFIGGGSDREQKILVDDLNKHRKKIIESIDKNVVMLLICGGYQMLGSYYLSQNGARVECMGIFDYSTKVIEGNERATGYIGLQTKIDSAPMLVGFENHSGETFLGEMGQPLGEIVFGIGNNHYDKNEGFRYKNCFGTYVHGPLLARNVDFADYLITLMLQKNNINMELCQLNDEFANEARKTVIYEENN